MKDLSKPELIFLKPNKNENGQLHFMEEPTSIPFAVKRLFWLDRITEDVTRGIHAHREELQVLVCLSGRVTALLENLAGEKFSFELDSPSKALFVPSMVWTEFTFGKGAVLLGISDRQFSEEDYIRQREEFDSFQKNFALNSQTIAN
ncbi:sugar 3,4-ketoisomerase [Cognataquiflexum aquatile]|uniref:sugar 3,4-ketoisomerase n=1 Tax=Cognataquiflexum aquatile TaxID=2249427 RepID=UPI00130080DD|nr:FdtA/QdtA family cupin domain-containing protein [Cognataquiflexum aquatile]